MDEKKILVKEVCHKASVLSQFDGIIKTSIPIHEIYEIRHEIKHPRVLVGKKVIALLGSIRIKVFCVKKESLEVYSIEQSINYRNYIPGDYFFHHLKPCTTVKSELQDIIITSIEEDGITLAGIILTDLTLALEKEYDLSLLLDNMKNRQEHQIDSREPMDRNENIQLEELITSNANCSPEKNTEEELYAEVSQDSNQDLTIILE